MLLNDAFYQRTNVTQIARELLGKALFTRIGRKTTAGIIVETEAYSWRERGCHAYQGKMTARNEVMFRKGGLAYVYLCYGMHNLFNVVTNQEGKADAVLIRALEPIEGIEEMMKRMNASKPRKITAGPGKLTRAMGIDRKHNGATLTSKSVWLADVGKMVGKRDIEASSRVGIDYAGPDALLPWRFTLKDNEWVSR
jgi:DNA-3-methyladenine glycosylase